jgi:DNA-binding MarR family transcriptional regulator
VLLDIKQYIQINQALFSLAHSYELRMMQDKRARDAGLKLSDCAVLMVLGQTEPTTASGLSDNMAINRGTISLYVQRLVERDFVTRERDRKNRRLWWLTLTQAGTEAYEAIRDGTARHGRNILSPLSATEQKTLHRLLLKLSHGLGFGWQ